MTDYPTALAAARECLDNEGHRATDALRDLLASLDAQVPDGYALVPVEPTQEMLDAAGMCIVPDGKEWLDQSNRETWAAMLAAALPAPAAATQNPKEK